MPTNMDEVFDLELENYVDTLYDPYDEWLYFNVYRN